jgi:glycerol dehydrogenase
MTRIFIAPSKYIQGPGLIKKLEQYTANAGSGKPYLLVDSFIAQSYKADIISSYEDKNIDYHFEVCGAECSQEEIQKHLEQVKEGDYAVIVGIGGGKTIDTTKAVAYYADLPVYVAPTAASTDAPTSALSVLYTEDGEFDTYLFLKQNPDAVLVDEELIVNAPVRLFRAGMGDALATYYEADAHSRSHSTTMAGGIATQSALALTRLCLRVLLEDGVKASKAVEAKALTKAVSNVIEANTLLSGLGFESGGVAGAHAIHNGMTAIPELHDLLHGEKVAFGTLTQMVLENRSLDEIDEIIEFCQEVGLPTNFEELGIPDVTKEQLMEVAKIANGENDTMSAMGFKVSDEDIVAAMYSLDSLSKEFDWLAE